MFKSTTLFLASLCTAMTVLAAAETGPASRACSDKLDEVAGEIADLRNNQDIAPASAGATQNGQQSPLADLVKKISDGQKAQSELAIKAAEQQRELNNERFRQLNELNDKIHDFNKSDFKRRMEIKNAQTAKKAADSDTLKKCYLKAEEQFNAEMGINEAKSATGNFEVTSMSRVKGTSKRMNAKLSLNNRKCLANPVTQQEFRDAEDALAAKIHNFELAQEEIISDVSFTQSKIALVENHIGGQKAELAGQIDMQMAQQRQQMMMDLMALDFAKMSTSSASDARADSARRLLDADAIVRYWEKIVITCKNSDSRPWEVPADIYLRFSKVNSACRGESSATSPCVKSSGQMSPRNTPATDDSGNRVN